MVSTIVDIIFLKHELVNYVNYVKTLIMTAKRKKL